MPATYAHYRFGASMLNSMPADFRRTAKRYRRLFDVGLHGPDLFFFYRPVFTTKIGNLGRKYHRQTGKEFFSRVCRNLRLDPSEAAQSYLYGVLCHYSLDAACHPFVWEKDAEGVAAHSRIEAEFDRFLLEQDGKLVQPPLDLSSHMELTPAECAVAARFYPEVTPKQLRECLSSMARIRKILAMPDGNAREAVTKTIKLASREFGNMLFEKNADPVCRELNGPLMERYRQAAERFPEQLTQLGAHLAYNAPLGDAFNPIFG